MLMKNRKSGRNFIYLSQYDTVFLTLCVCFILFLLDVSAQILNQSKLIASKDWIIKSHDIKNAYLQAEEIIRLVYMEPPPELKKVDKRPCPKLNFQVFLLIRSWLKT